MRQLSCRTLTATIVTAATFLVVAAAHATIVAEFTGGNGTTSPDQYVGTAGDGWVTPWRTVDEVLHGGVTWTNSVASANPVAGGGNYLSGHAEVSAGFFNDGALQRHFGEGGSTGISYDAEHTVTWRFRVDAATDFTARSTEAFGDGIRFDDRVGLDSPRFGGDLPIWVIHTFTDVGPPQWMFGNFFDFNSWEITSTNVHFVVGDLYEFTVHVDDLSQGTWDGTVTNLDWNPADGGLATFTLNDMDAGGFDEIATSGGFTMTVGFGGDNIEDLFPADGSIDFSLDSLRITGPAAIPEAHTVLIWSGLTLAALVTQWWRTRRAANQ
jgi:hypothetical protein